MNKKNLLNSDDSDQKPIKHAFAQLLHPIPFITLIILISVILLIAAGLFELDRGKILKSLRDVEFARGLITYLFAVGTIGAVVILILAALLGKDDMKVKFARAKEILTILLGIFGTIIGFYFGTQVGIGQEALTEISIQKPLVTEIVTVGENFTYITHISGGVPPYLYSIRIDPKGDPDYEKFTQGWIEEDFTAPKVDKDTITIRLDVKDTKGNFADSEKKIFVKQQE